MGTKWGFRDASGKVLFGRKYEYGWYISEGKVSYCDDGLCGYLDRTGEIIIPARFCAVREFHEGLAAAAIQCSEDANGNLRAVWGYIDVSGEFALVPSPVFTGLPFRDGLVIARKGGKFGLMDRQGNVSVDFQFSVLETQAARDTNGKLLFRVQKGEQSGFINIDGSILTGKFYPSVIGFEQGVALVLMDDLTWTLIDSEGQILARTNFTLVGLMGELFSCHRMLVGYVPPERRAEVLQLLEHHGIKGYFQLQRSEGIKFGFLDANGLEVIPAKFDSARPFRPDRSGECAAEVSVGLKFYKIGIDGTELANSQ